MERETRKKKKQSLHIIITHIEREYNIYIYIHTCIYIYICKLFSQLYVPCLLSPCCVLSRRFTAWKTGWKPTSLAAPIFGPPKMFP